MVGYTTLTFRIVKLPLMGIRNTMTNQYVFSVFHCLDETNPQHEYSQCHMVLMPPQLCQ